MRLSLLFITLAVALFAAAAAALPAAAQRSGELCFPDVPGINDCLTPTFASYWRTNGGLPVFGYPISPAEPYSPEAGVTVTAQWTERNRMELHPQNPPAYRVQLGRMGAERLAQFGRDWAAEPRETGPQPGCLWFPETGRNVCDQGAGVGFKSYWERNGLRVSGLSPYQQSLALFGLPLTSANPEPGPNGELIVTQWFERARFEWHPDNPADYKVLLGLLGNEVRSAAVSSQIATPLRGDRSIFGVEISRGTVGRVFDRLIELEADWVRYNGVLWQEVETRQGRRDWSRLSAVEAELAAITNTGATAMLVVRGAPEWAQAVPGKPCGPIRPEALPAFASFVGELVARYSGPPYNIKYWELGNEPDAPYALVGGVAPFGCWGATDQPYNNGAAYAAMLKAVYPAIKAADPEAQVVFGGLLLECDPDRPAAERPCLTGTFLEGVLRAGGGDAFDILAYHSYVYWGPVTHDWDLRFLPWSHRGGALLGKRAFLNEVLSRYGYSKPLLMNEGGLLCYRFDPSCGPGGFYEAQANYLVRLYVRSLAADIVASIWFPLNGPGFNDSGLLDRQQQPRPAFAAARFVSEMVAGARYVSGTVEGAVERHTLATPDAVYTVVWTNDGSTVSLPLPDSTRGVYTMVGTALPADPATALVVGFEPRIIVSRP